MTEEEKKILEQAEAIKKKEVTKTKEKKKGRFMKITLVVIFLFLIVYVAISLFLFYKTGAEPSTLTTCVFAFCSIEGGLLGWIKTSKSKSNKRSREDDIHD